MGKRALGIANQFTQRAAANERENHLVLRRTQDDARVRQPQRKARACDVIFQLASQIVVRFDLVDFVGNIHVAREINDDAVAINRVIRSLPRSYRNVVVADWAGITAGDPERLLIDGGPIPTPDGAGTYSGVVRGHGDDWLLFDFNHPLAGHAVRFEVEVLGVLA